jgi:hypothetical protein
MGLPICLHDNAEGAVFVEMALVDAEPEAFIVFRRVRGKKSMAHRILSALK